MNTLCFVLLAVSWSFAISIADTLSLSLFIDKVGAEHLPLSYLLSSLTMIGASCLFLYFLRITSPYKILTGVMVVELSFYIVTSFILTGNPPKWFWFMMQTCTYVFVDSLIACFWTFIDQYHDLQEAKRVFGLYNACYFLGYMLGGTLINLGFEALGAFGLIIIVNIIMGCSIFIAYYINQQVACVEDDSIDALISGGKKAIGSIIQAFFKSPFALFLAGMSMLTLLLRTSTEYGYANAFENHFSSLPNGTQNIPEFLGKLKAFICLGNIILGSFFYRRFVGRLGVANMMIIPPLYFFMLYSEWTVSSSFLIAILGVIAVEGVLPTLEDSNFNLLVNAAPSKLKGTLRIINDSFFEPIGTLLGSLVLLFLDPENRWFGLFLALAFFAISLVVRSLYPQAIFTNLRQNAIHFERKLQDWISKVGKKEQREIKSTLLNALSSAEESTSLKAFEWILTSLEDHSLLSHLLYRASSYSEEGKITAIKLISKSKFATESKSLEAVNRWMDYSNSNDLANWSNLFLAKQGLLHPDKTIAELDNTDLLKRATAIITLKKSLANQSIENAGLNRTIASKELDLLLQSMDENEIQLGLEILEEIPEEAHKAFHFLSHSSLKIKRAAARTLAKIADKTLSRYAYKLIEELENSSDNQLRLYCLTALGNIGDSSTVKEIISASLYFRPNERRLAEKEIMKIGLKTVPTLLSITKDLKMHERCRILAAKILGRLSLPQLQTNLIEIIEIEIKKAYFYFFHAHLIQKQYPEYDLNLLENALFTGFQSILDFIIHLLGIAGSIEDSDLLVHILRSKNAKAHAHAVEIVERHSNIRIFRQILPLLDDMPFEEKLDAYNQAYGQFPTLALEELLNKLLDSPSLFDQTMAAHLKAKCQMPDWKQSLKEQIKTAEGPLHQYMYELLEI